DFGLSMPPSERLEEIGALATMVDENRHRYSLDALCEWRGRPGKDEALLREGCAALGLIPKRKKLNPQACIWQLPARFAGAYAEIDATRTLELYEDLNPILDQENTRAAYRLEVALAAACASLSVDSVSLVLAGLTNTATRATPGTSVRRNPSRLAANSP